MALAEHCQNLPEAPPAPGPRRRRLGGCRACRPATFGVFLCDECLERARQLRAGELAAARNLVGIFSGIFSAEPKITAGQDEEKERAPGVAAPGPKLNFPDRAPVRADTSVPARVTEGIVTKWRPHAERARVEVFADPVAGYGVGPAGRFAFVPGRSIAGLLRALPIEAERVYLTGPVPGATPDGRRAWAAPARMPKGWAPATEFVERQESPILRYRHEPAPGDRARFDQPGGRLVEIHRAAAWFGENDATPEDAGAARRELGQLLATKFPGGPGLLATPATTGVELWRSLIPYGHEWPVLSAELRELIHETMGQGRQQFFPPAAGELGELVVYDGRLMYGALCRELPAGVPSWDGSGAFHGHARARYRFTATVPPGWDRLGVLGVQGDDGWRYPCAPGERFTSWADGAELLTAGRAGWKFEIHEAWVWPGGGPDPLRGWAERLMSLRRDAGELVANALRAILITTLGRFAGRTRYLTRSCPVAEPGPAEAALAGGAAERYRIEGDRLVWAERHEPAAELSHPEWAAAVYGRARARLLHCPTGARDVFAGALYVDPAALLRVYTDSLTLTFDPAWPDDGANGRLRLKRRVPGPIPAPSSDRALAAIQRGLQ